MPVSTEYGWGIRVRGNRLERHFLVTVFAMLFIWMASGFDPAIPLFAAGLTGAYAGLLTGWPLGVLRYERRTRRELWVREEKTVSFWRLAFWHKGTVTVVAEPARA